MADGDGARFGLSGADHEHIGNFLHLRIADLGRQFFVAVIEMDADAVALESFGHMLRIVGDFLTDWTDFDLHGSEPERERSGVMLDQDAEESLDGAEQSAM